jgi:hypothetical protein
MSGELDGPKIMVFSERPKSLMYSESLNY